MSRIWQLLSAVGAALTAVLYILRLRDQRDDAQKKAEKAEESKERTEEVVEKQTEAREEASKQDEKREKQRADGDRSGGLDNWMRDE